MSRTNAAAFQASTYPKESSMHLAFTQLAAALRRGVSSRYALTVITAALIAWLGPASPAAAVQRQAVAVSVYDMSTGRVTAIVAALLGLIGMVVGGQTLWRSKGHRRSAIGLRAAVVALAAGMIGTALGAVVVATADGGLGTGNGLGGALVAILFGVLGMVLGGQAWARHRRPT
jgi:hypothetical protein